MEHPMEDRLIAKLRECSGTLFWFCAGNDRERIALFRRAAEAVGRQGRDGRAVCTGIGAEKQAERFDRNALFVTPGMREYLERYLDACPPGARHLLVWSRRNNGLTPTGSDFLEMWRERGVERLCLDTMEEF